MSVVDRGRTIRVDIVSDTHGKLSVELLSELSGADVIVHAGDACSPSDLATLCDIAPVYFCLGNMNDASAYHDRYEQDLRFEISCVRFQVVHHRERTSPEEVDVCVFGYTHVPVMAWKGDYLMMNPGSPTKPHSELGSTIGRLSIADGHVLNPTIIRLNMVGEERAVPFWKFI